MSTSDRVSLAGELAAVRLVNECRELGDDAGAWQRRLVAGLLELTGGMVAAVGPSPPHQRSRLDRLPEWVAGQTGGGWPSPEIRDRWLAWGRDPERIAAHPAVVRFFARPEPTLSLTRRELVDDRPWDRSAFINEHLRADGMDEGLVSRSAVPVVGGGYTLTVVRAAGERPFGVAAGRLVAHVQRELAPHLGRSLLLTVQPNRHGLSPRLRQALDCLLDGDGEKQVALRLGVHPTTAHDHVKRLYRHFGVCTRAELLAYFLRAAKAKPHP
jgi:DNA-binding CsgD family transcriptional regulator